MSSKSEGVTTRLSMAGVGAVAGLSIWALFELVPELIASERLVLLLVTFGLSFFAVLMALLGPARLLPAACAAAVIALPGTLLFFWASFRYDEVGVFLDMPLHGAALAVLLTIPLPFVAGAMQRPSGWRKYDLLFDLAWTIVVRYAAALLFLAMVWGVLMLSNALLGLVGITAIDWLLDQEPVPYLLSGLVLGLGLAIVHELRDYVSPFLILQLLRVLLPVLLVVLAIFILALPFRGISGLFGHYSASVALVGVVLAALSLITATVHRDDDLTVEGKGMLIATQALALLLPVPAVLVLYALWLRVAQYGLTPDRVAGALIGVVVLAYAVLYAVSVLMRRGWAERIRRVNRVMAVITVALAALWLTPVLNAERITVADQIARARAGAPPEQLGLWEMAHTWGRAGEAGLERLRQLDGYPAPEQLSAQIDRARASGNLWDYSNEAGAPMIALDGRVPIRPEGAPLPEGGFGGLHDSDRRMIADACARRLPGGHPGCVIVLAEFDPLRGTQTGVGLFFQGQDRVIPIALGIGPNGFFRQGYVNEAATGQPAWLTPAHIVDILEGRFDIVPAPRNVLEIGGKQLFPDN